MPPVAAAALVSWATALPAHTVWSVAMRPAVRAGSTVMTMAAVGVRGPQNPDVTSRRK